MKRKHYWDVGSGDYGVFLILIGMLVFAVVWFSRWGEEESPQDKQNTVQVADPTDSQSITLPEPSKPKVKHEQLVNCVDGACYDPATGKEIGNDPEVPIHMTLPVQPK